jgi:hypothetical protein
VLRPALLILKLDAGRRNGSDDATSSAPPVRFVLRIDTSVDAAMTAEMDYCRLNLIEDTHHVVYAHCPLRSELEVIAAR